MKGPSQRPTQVANEPQNSNFAAGTALENLRAEVIEIEALAYAAGAAADLLPAPTTDRQRLLFGRIQSLVTKTSQQVSASLTFASAQVAALTASQGSGGMITGRPKQFLRLNGRMVGVGRGGLPFFS